MPKTAKLRKRPRNMERFIERITAEIRRIESDPKNMERRSDCRRRHFMLRLDEIEACRCEPKSDIAAVHAHEHLEEMDGMESVHRSLLEANVCDDVLCTESGRVIDLYTLLVEHRH